MLLSRITSSWLVLRLTCMGPLWHETPQMAFDSLGMGDAAGYRNRQLRLCVFLQRMERSANPSCVQSRVTSAVAEWNQCAGQAGGAGPRFCSEEQQKREAAYDEALEKVEREAKHAPRGGRQRAEAQ